ncbi:MULTISPECIES: hypothetical protein [Alteribacter]|uniref:Uncharacterized protein n=1 Tax=Alteribacter keqinensis TaxID=2483800 RepID=A0A3M7TQW8_9BACI|nr:MULTISPECIES: hypothetical protein [Alteribacter]MBM7095534.1 hypothetical protein [Alteribacter salitolerans]RNA67865.1 hypothetical protein EBO34_14275 [Alteribacter keqinensis]
MISQAEEERIAIKLTDRFYEEYGEMLKKFGDRGRTHTKNDIHHHFNYLKTAHELNNKTTFTDYAIWLNTVLTSRGVPTELLEKNFQWLIEEFENHDDPEVFYIETLELALQELREVEQHHK